MRVKPVLSVLALAATTAAAGEGGPLNLYEWLAVAPVVVEGENLGSHGKYAEFRVGAVLRGEGTPSGTIRVNVRGPNRDRNRHVDEEPLRFEKDLPYLLLLDPAGTRGPQAARTFDLVRGTRGAREVPLEGRDPFIDAARRFVEIQDRNDDRATWREFGSMIEDTNRFLVETALDQFLKFRRGEPRHLGSVRPLLDHPAAEMRERAARLIGQILERNGEARAPDATALRSELIARARRDKAVPVRVAATRALNALGGREVDAILAEIAAGDADQTVRYAAERVLYERRQAGERETAPESRKGTEETPRPPGTD